MMRRRMRPQHRFATGPRTAWSTSSAGVPRQLPCTSPPLPARCAIARRVPSRLLVPAPCSPASNRCSLPPTPMQIARVNEAGAGARFVNIGERCNVTGSARFKKLILAGDYDAAVEVASDQVENRAQIIDVNVDEALLDSEQAMTIFLKRIAAEPDIARVPGMINSSNWSVIQSSIAHSPVGTVDLPEAHRGRAGHRPRAGDDRQFQMERDRGGAQVRLG